jgi:hypothetical protein
MEENNCYCWAMDDFPGVCKSCEERLKKAEESLEKLAREQLSLAENDEKRIFTTQEIYDVNTVKCDKKMMHRKLLQKMRQILKIN